MTKTRKNDSIRVDFASITRIHGLARRRADEIAEKFGPGGRAGGYRKTLAL